MKEEVYVREKTKSLSFGKGLVRRSANRGLQQAVDFLLDHILKSEKGKNQDEKVAKMPEKPVE